MQVASRQNAYIVLLSIDVFWSHYYYSSLAPKGSKVKLYKLLSGISVRQRGLLGLQGVNLGTLTAYDAKIQEIHHAPKPVLGLGSESVT